ncbi:unnamed protein product, partial [marine sediment metagenome]
MAGCGGCLPHGQAGDTILHGRGAIVSHDAASKGR